MTIEAHDPHHLPETDLEDKGLSHNAVGLIGGTVLGISSVAPAHALTATIGIPLMGSVSQQVLAHADCPVAIVRPSVSE
jgi:hypothetical protein